MPSLRAASNRAWPAMITPSAPTRIGFVHPNSTMLAATCATCSSEWVREFLAYGMSLSIGHSSTMRSRRARTVDAALSNIVALPCAIFIWDEALRRLGLRLGGVEAPPEAVTTTGTRAAIVWEMAAARALAITGVRDVNKSATLAVTASALTASPAPAAATAPLVVSLAAVPAGDTVCWLSVVPTWPDNTMPAVDGVIYRGGVLRPPAGRLRQVQRDRFPGALPRQAFAPVVELFIEEQLDVFGTAQQARLVGDRRGKIGIAVCHTGNSFQLRLRFRSCSPERRAAIWGCCKLVENNSLDEVGSGALLWAVEKAPDRGAESGARHEVWGVHLLAGHSARGGDSGHLLSGFGENRFLAGEVRHPAQDHIAVRRADLNTESSPAEHMGGGHRCAAAEKRIEDDVPGVGERLHEELNQRTRKGGRVRSLAALGFHLNDIAWPRDAGKPAILVGGSLLARRRSTSPGT